MRYFVIVNPISGRGLGEKSIPIIEKRLQEERVPYHLARTERPWHAAELAEQAAREGYDVIVSASGDGTLNETLNGLMRARQAGFNHAALGVIAIGTGNDFAGGVGIPADFERSLSILLSNKRRKIDVGLVKGGNYPQGRFFGNGIGIGFDAAVGFAALKVRFLRGLPAYLIGAIQTVFFYYTPPRLRIELDGEPIEQYSLMVSIMNGYRMGGGFRMAPHSRPDDGLFDLCIAEQASKLRIFQLIPMFIQGQQEGQPEIKMRRARQVRVTALEGDFPAHADGETLCTNGKELMVELHAGELEVVCGAGSTV
ncbi:MAG: diacylglycerol kinase family lipid kinase [Anaerolineales bacterium]|nr:diacylglycerol kinase family lipid kinase [Anaerolineales bacterium]MCX7754221.1 diacylglycerol kinase family lipid kinase [Anaerolineales bacterium]MDW8276929.1 diacylglycerol kinase family lipid kinase [Anaerolineales bacterium]